jgi:hypothetical protein
MMEGCDMKLQHLNKRLGKWTIFNPEELATGAANSFFTRNSINCNFIVHAGEHFRSLKVIASNIQHLLEAMGYA